MKRDGVDIFDVDAKPSAAAIQRYLAMKDAPNHELNLFFQIEKLDKDDFAGTIAENAYKKVLFEIACSGYLYIIDHVIGGVQNDINDKLLVVIKMHEIYQNYVKLDQSDYVSVGDCISAIRTLILFEYDSWAALYNMCLYLNKDQDAKNKKLIKMLEAEKKKEVIITNINGFIFVVSSQNELYDFRRLLSVFLSNAMITKIVIQHMYEKYLEYVAIDEADKEAQFHCLKMMRSMMLFDSESINALYYMHGAIDMPEGEKKDKLRLLLKRDEKVPTSAIRWSLNEYVPCGLFDVFLCNLTKPEISALYEGEGTILHCFFFDKLLDAHDDRWSGILTYKNALCSVLFQVIILEAQNIFDVVDCEGRTVLDAAIIALSKYKQLKLNDAIEKCIYAIGLLIGFGADPGLSSRDVQNILSNVRLTDIEFELFSGVYSDGSEQQKLIMKFLCENLTIKKDEAKDCFIGRRSMVAIFSDESVVAGSKKFIDREAETAATGVCVIMR